MTFGISAHLAAMQEPAPQELVRAEVEKLLTVLDEKDPNLLAELGSIPVNRATLAELAFWNARLAPSSQRDRIGGAAARFFAVQTLATTVMRELMLDSAARFSPGVERMLEKGALGLFEVGQAQFVTLAREARAIADWLTAREAKSVALVEVAHRQQLRCGASQRTPGKAGHDRFDGFMECAAKRQTFARTHGGASRR